MIDIKKLREICDAATPGPWESVVLHIPGGQCAMGPSHASDDMGRCAGDAPDHDALFISAARTAMPELLDEVERLQKENKHLREAEFHARKMAGECMLCPHLGVGEPLVDEQERELERLRACVGEIGEYLSDVWDLSEEDIRAIITRHTV